MPQLQKKGSADTPPLAIILHPGKISIQVHEHTSIGLLSLFEQRQTDIYTYLLIKKGERVFPTTTNG